MNSVRSFDGSSYANFSRRHLRKYHHSKVFTREYLTILPGVFNHKLLWEFPQRLTLENIQEFLRKFFKELIENRIPPTFSMEISSRIDTEISVGLLLGILPGVSTEALTWILFGVSSIVNTDFPFGIQFDVHRRIKRENSIAMGIPPGGSLEIPSEVRTGFSQWTNTVFFSGNFSRNLYGNFHNKSTEIPYSSYGNSICS